MNNQSEIIEPTKRRGRPRKDLQATAQSPPPKRNNEALQISPLYLTIGQWCRKFNRSKNVFYRLVKANKIRAIKDGKTTLADTQSSVDYYNSLPSIGDDRA